MKERNRTLQLYFGLLIPMSLCSCEGDPIPGPENKTAYSTSSPQNYVSLRDKVDWLRESGRSVQEVEKVLGKASEVEAVDGGEVLIYRDLTGILSIKVNDRNQEVRGVYFSQPYFEPGYDKRTLDWIREISGE